MNKIKTIDDFRQYIGSAVETGLANIKGEWIQITKYNTIIELTGWKEVRVVLVGKPETGIRLCERAKKQNGETELMVLRKTVVSAGGLSVKEWERVENKSMLWLEKHNLYPKQKRISSNTNPLL